MPLYSTLVCAIDFSEHSRRALQLALRVRQRMGSRVVAVHVIEQVLAEAAATLATGSTLPEEVTKELQAFVAQELAPGAAVPECVVRIGRPNEQILACAADAGARLIVMGTQGLGGIRKWFFGSITEKVLRDSHVQVLVVPLSDTTVQPDPQRIVASIQIGAPIDAVVKAAVALARTLSVPLTLLHVVSRVHGASTAADAVEAAARRQAADARGYLSDLASRIGGEVPTGIEVRIGGAAEQIAAMAAEFPGAVIVIGAGGTDTHRPGSVAYRVLSLCDAPVLTVPG